MPVPGVGELLIILVIVAMLFGVGKLPEVFGAVGKGIREFRRESALDDLNGDAQKAGSEPPADATNNGA
ncbi:MAG: twin-arginine translocase TatA/TatE family subunit [Caldilineaceae bacterium]|nr:twin-arginine translocase TatA/TatE family subunit [Caldilineaceae bacterium]